MIYRFVYRHGFNYKQFLFAMLCVLWALAIPFMFAVSELGDVAGSVFPFLYVIGVFYGLYRYIR